MDFQGGMAVDFFRAGLEAARQAPRMTKGAWLMVFGVFLFVCGAAAYLLNPNQAPTSLVAGAIGGGIIAMLGVMVMKGSTKWALTTRGTWSRTLG